MDKIKASVVGDDGDVVELIEVCDEDSYSALERLADGAGYIVLRD